MKRYFLVLTLVCVFFIIGCKYESFNDKLLESYAKLENVLNERKLQLINYVNEIQNLARKVRHDETMLAFFKAKNQYYYWKKEAELPDKLVQEIEKLKQNIQYYYLLNYQSFYDIMFVDTRGEIFYAIRKQADYHKNIFEGELANTALSQKLKNFTHESFVDFQFYEISGEPSAFFIEPLLEGQKLIGWFVLQCSVNNINSLFESNKDLGKTGEVVLVNKDHYLLSDSRFNPNHTILKQQLPAENIELKFKEKRGRLSVTDYRGREVISAFDVFDFLGSEWLIIAKMDKDELLTDYYLENADRLNFKLEKGLSNNTSQYFSATINKHGAVNVDIDEYQRADTSVNLYTQGISTCTALIVSYPGKFSYMAHISPHDVLYGNTKTDLVNQVLWRLSYFEIPLSEKQNLNFYIVANHKNSYKKLIGTILKDGYFLSQIKFIYNPDAEYANVYCNCCNAEFVVNWKKRNSDIFEAQNFKNITSLSKILQVDNL